MYTYSKGGEFDSSTSWWRKQGHNTKDCVGWKIMCQSFENAICYNIHFHTFQISSYWTSNILQKAKNFSASLK